MTYRTTHTLPTGREHTFEGDHLYHLRITRALDDAACEQHRAAGLPVPTLDDGGENEEFLTIAAPRDGLANTYAMSVTTLRFRGHLALIDEALDDGTFRPVHTGGAS